MARTFIVRFNVEYSIEVQAESEDDAIAKVPSDTDTWDQRSTSFYEAEEVEPEPPESQESKHCDAGYMNDVRFGTSDD